MLPSQQITPEWLLTVLRRRWWLLALPLLLAGLGTATYAQFLPDRYRSEAVILVTPPTLPSNYVRPTVTLPLSERLRILQQEVLSRARLERIILDLDLYRTERSNGIMEDVVTQMRSKDISVSPPRSAQRRNSDAASFVVGFNSDNPRVAHQVAERLTSLFVDENARQRETIAEGTDQFLTAEVQAARMRLEETESRLEAYKRQFGGQLPEQLQSNLTALQNIQVQIQSLSESINRDRSEQLTLERQMTDLTGGSGDAGEPIDAPPPPPTGLEESLAKARAQLDALLLRLTPDHPDVRRQERVIEDLSQRVSDAQLRRPVSPGTLTPTMSPAARARANQLLELRRRHEQLGQSIANKQRQIDTRQAQSGSYQARVDAAPAREAELIGLTRDYETLKNRYNLLLARSEEAKVAANMERRQVSEQFRIVDPPRVPQRPVSPDRVRMSIMGAIAGLGVGVLLVGLLEYRDRSFRTEADIVANLALPVVAVVPMLMTRSERRARWRRRWMLSASGLAVMVAAVVVAFWKFGL